MHQDQFQLVFALGDIVRFPKPVRRGKSKRCCMNCPVLADTTLALRCAVDLLDDQAFLAWESRLAWLRRVRCSAAI